METIIIVSGCALVYSFINNLWADHKIKKEIGNAFNAGYEQGNQDTSNEIMYQVQEALKTKDETLKRQK